MLHRLRGGVNPRVQAQIQAIADDMAQQGKLSSVLDFPPETSALLDIPETLQARQFQRKQQQSWGDWLYEKTVTKVADLMGKSRPSQRQIEDQLDETLATLNRKSGRQKESTHPPTLVTQQPMATDLTRRTNYPPVIINPSPDQVIELNVPYTYCLNTATDFQDSNGDRISLTATLSNGSPLPGWLQFQLKLVGSHDTPGYADNVATDGNFAFIADGSSGLQIVDISNPATPTVVANYISSYVYDVQIQGTMAFLATSNGLRIIDISNPTVPIQLGSAATYAEAVSIAVSDTRALIISNMPAYLYTFDITTPTNPSLLSSYTLSTDLGRDVAIRGQLAFTISGRGLDIIDLIDPNDPVSVSIYSDVRDGSGLTVTENLVLVARVDNGLEFIDISDLANPISVGNYNRPGWTDWSMDVVVNENYAMLASGPMGLQVVDFSNPANATLVGTYDTPDMAWGVSVSGNLVFVADQGFVADQSSGLQIINWEQYCFQGTPLANNLETISIQVMADDRQGGVVTDIFQLHGNNPPSVNIPLNDQSTHIDEIFKLDIQPDSTFTDPDGDYIALSAQQTDGEMLPPWLDFSFLDLMGYYETNAATIKTTHNGDVALIAHWNTGLQAIDISDPATPTLLGSYEPIITSSPKDIEIIEGLALVAYGELGLQIFNITDPSVITFVGEYQHPGWNWAQGIAVSGDIACIADGGGYGLVILNISNPAVPTLLVNYKPYSWSWATDIAVTEHLALVAAPPLGLQILDITHPETPIFVGGYPMTDPQRIIVDNNIVYVADVSAGLKIIDITNPSNPFLVGSYSNLLSTFAVQNSLAYLAIDNELRVLDLSDFSNPVLLGSYVIQGLASDIAVTENLALIADWDYGMWLIQTDNWILSGTPHTNDAGNYLIDVIATDSWGESGTDTFQLRVEGSPILIRAIPSQIVATGSVYNFNVAPYFLDPNGDSIVYTATLENTQPLPDWIFFNSVSGFFSGEPTHSDNAVLSIELSASDRMNAATQTVFTIIVDNFPEVTNPLSDYTTSAGSHFEFAVPDNTFTDRDNDVLRYSAMLSYGAPLPTWLTFDVDSMRFSGNPQDTDVGAIDVRLYVIDSYGGSISDDFRIGVESRITAMLADLGTALKYFGIATASYGFYKNRALFWNRLGGHWFNKKAEVATINEPYSRQLGIAEPNIHRIQTQIPRDNMPFTFGGRFFCGRWPLRDYPSRQLPSWLDYDRDRNVLQGTAASRDVEEMYIQVLGKGGVILEQFKLTVIPSSFPTVTPRLQSEMELLEHEETGVTAAHAI
ncbi:MAG: putative Ig domain-containing protein [Pseudomonadota bacterium]